MVCGSGRRLLGRVMLVEYLHNRWEGMDQPECGFKKIRRERGTLDQRWHRRQPNLQSGWKRRLDQNSMTTNQYTYHLSPSYEVLPCVNHNSIANTRSRYQSLGTPIDIFGIWKSLESLTFLAFRHSLIDHHWHPYHPHPPIWQVALQHFTRPGRPGPFTVMIWCDRSDHFTILPVQ